MADHWMTYANALQEEAAKFLSSVRDECKTSQKAVNLVVTGVDNLLSMFLDLMKVKFCHLNSGRDGYLGIKNVVSFLDSFKGQSLFEGINRPSLMESYLQEKSVGENVILKKKILSWKEVVRKGVPKLVPKEYGYVVSFLPQLQQLLNCKDVLDCVDNPIASQDGTIRTITDGLYYKHNPVVQEHGDTTLAIVMHVDDAEVCDPLKSWANKHNLRLFYWMLANIHPNKRSTLRAINLLSIVKAKVAKNKKINNDAFLEDFVQALIKLGTEGVVFNINGVLRRFYAILICACCDHPAACNLGGFKESHFAMRPCRVCMILRQHLCKDFAEDLTLLRNRKDHEKQLQQVSGASIKEPVVEVNVCEGNDDDDDDHEMSENTLLERYADHKNPSVNFGINNRSILSDVPYFDVTKCLPQDLLHLMAEGNCELVCRLLLKDACFPPQLPAQQGNRIKRRRNSSLSLVQVNNVIENVCDFGFDSVSKPSPILESHVKGSKLKQSAAQILILVRIMPFILRGYCSIEKMELLHKLLDLLDVCLYYEFSPSDVDRLQMAAQTFGSCLKSIYPNVNTIKLHALVHLKMQTILFGPPRQLWCFRFESMHSEFTSLVPVVRSKKDIALSVAKRHLSKRNGQIMEGKKDGTYLYKGDELIGKKSVLLSSLPSCVVESLPDITPGSNIAEVEKLLRYGSNWKQGVVILASNRQGTVTFGRILSIYLVSAELLFTYQEYETTFIEELRAYAIQSCKTTVKCIRLSDLAHPFPIPRYSLNFPQGVMAYLFYTELRH